jgi:acyl transferase domain-containing protein/NADPH:quinone reductase-like Zn-dependent oxidoreductase/acyl carrier protein
MESSDISERVRELPANKKWLLALKELEAKLNKSEGAKKEPIAIIGMGCRLPGGLHHPASYWDFLCEGKDAVGEIPPSRWDSGAFYDPDPAVPGKMTTRYGAFLDDVEQFDAAFFGISPREAISMDPQQRHLLEVTWEALEDARIAPDSLVGSRTGVFIGISSSDYSHLQTALGIPLDAYTGTGQALCVAAGRIAYTLGLQGPALALDTACSSSLVAAHYACQSLRSAECNLALVGGVNLLLTPESFIYYSKLQALASDGRCKTFDAAADGYGRGEGVGVVVLKRLSDALADGNTILALIRGSAVNQDGRSNGLTAPNGLAQQAVIRQALAQAEVEPAQVGYVETHGTGTRLGDPIEVQALGAVYCQAPRTRPLVLGAVKTNIGHLEAAAGIAGLIKVVQVLRHGVFPPLLHQRQRNPHIAWDELPIELPVTCRPWAQDANAGPRLAGLSAFGFSGTNAHLIVQEPGIAVASSALQPQPEQAGIACLLPLSARNEQALRELAARYLPVLQQAAERGLPLSALCYAASTGRAHHEWRLALSGRDYRALSERLQVFIAGETQEGLASSVLTPKRHHRLVFVFPGQGGQWRGMGRQLLATEAVFAQTIAECEQAMRPYLAWSLREQLLADERDSRLESIEVVQPLLFAVQVGLARLWSSWGLRPGAVIGHSMGEIAAVYIAGILSLEDAACIICRRSQLLQRLSGRGKMVVVELSLAEAQRMVAPLSQFLAIAASNGPRSTVLAGESAYLERLVHQLEQQNIFCRWIRVDVASHSPQIDLLRDDLTQALSLVRPRSGNIPFYSTVTGELHTSLEAGADYWIDNVRQPVRFWETMQRLLVEGYTQFVEISPHPTLLHVIEESARFLEKTISSWPSLQREQDERASLLETLAALYLQGQEVNWQKIHPREHHQSILLPTYPWQHENFWFEMQPGQPLAPGQPVSPVFAEQGHPLLGPEIAPATQQGIHLWETQISLRLFPYLREHQIGGASVVPAALYVEMLQAAARCLFADQEYHFAHITFENMLVLHEEQEQSLQVILSQNHPQRAQVQIFSRAVSSTTPSGSWICRASAQVILTPSEISLPAGRNFEIAAIQARCQHMASVDQLYERLRERGIAYGPAFQRVQEYWQGDREVLARLAPGAIASNERQAYHLHPLMLDAAFQALGLVLTAEDPATLYLPAGIDYFHSGSQPVDHNLWAYARLLAPPQGPDEDAEGEIFLFHSSGEMLLHAQGFRCRRLEKSAQPVQHHELEDWLYSLQWEKLPDNLTNEIAAEPARREAGAWLIFADRQGRGEYLARLLRADGERCIIIQQGAIYQRQDAERYLLKPTSSDAFSQFFAELSRDTQSAYRGIIYLWSLDGPEAEQEQDQDYTTHAFHVLHLVQALAQTNWRKRPRLWLVTAGVQRIEAHERVSGLAQAALWGLGRVICYEHADLACSCVDMSQQQEESELEALWREIRYAGPENQLALRASGRYVARLRHHNTHTQTGEPARRRPVLIPAEQRAYRLEIDQTGLLDTAVARETQRRAPAADEVEIQVYAAGLNFLDVLTAMGARPDIQNNGAARSLGIECAGVITRVGTAVRDLQIGDEVVALAPGSMAAYAVTSAQFVVAKPAHLTFEEAAGIPIAFLTAYYALVHCGRLSRGERVLIHYAAGGVGLAAVRLAQKIGAEIFATAGSPEKRAYLRSLGIEHCMDSRSCDFADEVLAATKGAGVDVVLNALTGDAAMKSLDVLAPYGRFLEIGKKDIYQHQQLNLWPFHKNLSYFAIDLARMLVERPAVCSRLFHEALALFTTREIEPLPWHAFSLNQSADALRYMAQAKQIGKVILTLHKQEIWIEGQQPSAGIRAEATYWITGGLGAVGLLVAQWLAQRGARHLVLTSRHMLSPEARTSIAAMQALGAEVRVMLADVSQQKQVEQILSTISREMPPLAGIFHAAGLLDDGLMLRQNVQRFQEVMAPKVSGAWNLHSATQQMPLDYFVLFSSAASLLGGPGQSNYAAANAYMDALSHYRQSQGLVSLSINWGPWARVGLAAAQDNRGARVAARGIASIEPEKGLELLEYLLIQCPSGEAQIGVFALNIRQWSQFYPQFAEAPLFRHLLEEARQGRKQRQQGGSMRTRLETAESAQRKSLLEEHLCAEIAGVLKLDPARLDRQGALERLGFDSLMALELRNRLERSLGLTLPATLIWAYPTMVALAAYLSEQFEHSLNGQQAEHTPEATDRSEQLAEDRWNSFFSSVRDITESDLDTAIAQEIDRLAASEFVTDWLEQIEEAPPDLSPGTHRHNRLTAHSTHSAVDSPEDGLGDPVQNGSGPADLV